MHKLVILIEAPDDPVAFDELWPQFLHLAERMPDLRRESISRVDVVVYGANEYALMHELFFESKNAIHRAMTSATGHAAGRLLQKMTGGRMVLFVADHKEDEIKKIRAFRNGKDQSNAHDQ